MLTIPDHLISLGVSSTLCVMINLNHSLYLVSINLDSFQIYDKSSDNSLIPPWSTHKLLETNTCTSRNAYGQILTLPDLEKELVVETDASAIGIGVVLMQEGHSIAYLSKALSP